MQVRNKYGYETGVDRNPPYNTQIFDKSAVAEVTGVRPEVLL